MNFKLAKSILLHFQLILVHEKRNHVLLERIFHVIIKRCLKLEVVLKERFRHWHEKSFRFQDHR